MLRPSNTTGVAQKLAHAWEVGLAELVPLGDHRQRVGALQRVVALAREVIFDPKMPLATFIASGS